MSRKKDRGDDEARLYQDDVAPGSIDPSKPLRVELTVAGGRGLYSATLDCTTSQALMRAYRELHAKRPHRSAATKRAQVRSELLAPGGLERSDRDIADKLGVTHTFVGRVRKLAAVESGRHGTGEPYRRGRDGKVRRRHATDHTETKTEQFALSTGETPIHML